MTTTTKSKTPHARFFAFSDACVANGSFRKVVFSPAYSRGEKTYINGDYMGSLTFDLNTPAECAAAADALLAEGMKEYGPKDFKMLAPECVGGRGRA